MNSGHQNMLLNPHHRHAKKRRISADWDKMRLYARSLAWPLALLLSLICLRTLSSQDDDANGNFRNILRISDSSHSASSGEDRRTDRIRLAESLKLRRFRRGILSASDVSVDSFETVADAPNFFDSNLKNGDVKVPYHVTLVDEKNAISLPEAVSTSKVDLPKAAESDDLVLITVKTTAKYHDSRLRTILQTWFTLALDVTYFFTDADDEKLSAETRGHLVNTKCSSSHHRQALCCKMGAEYDFFMKTDKRFFGKYKNQNCLKTVEERVQEVKKWFCHFDDDNYVNVPQLYQLLSEYDANQEWYLGKPSTREPIQIMDRDNMPNKVSFWFATGGAGFCLSRPLAERMAPYTGDGHFVSLGDKIRLPDDVTMGYVVEYLLHQPLTIVPKLHSHLESMRMIDVMTLKEQVSLSAGSYSPSDDNVIQLDGTFSDSEDPTKFKTIHCFIFPESEICRGRSAPMPTTTTPLRRR